MKRYSKIIIGCVTDIFTTIKEFNWRNHQIPANSNSIENFLFHRLILYSMSENISGSFRFTYYICIRNLTIFDQYHLSVTHQNNVSHTPLFLKINSIYFDPFQSVIFLLKCFIYDSYFLYTFIQYSIQIYHTDLTVLFRYLVIKLYLRTYCSHWKLLK